MAHVLVVDDDSIVRSVVVQFLQLGGHTATEASSGFEALDTLSDAQPDLVLTDFSMPGMTGLELRKIGRDVVPEVPFVVMSGQFLSEHVRAEFDAALGKPLSPDDLLSTVAQIVDRNHVAA